MNYFLFSGIPGIINISWIIVQYCPITVKPFPFIFIHPALSFLIAFEGGFFISFNPNNASFLYLFSTSLSYTPPIFFFPILYTPYSLLSSNPHICRVLLGTVGYCGVLWGTVGCCGVLWGTVGYYGATLGYCGWNIDRTIKSTWPGTPISLFAVCRRNSDLYLL